MLEPPTQAYSQFNLPGVRVSRFQARPRQVLRDHSHPDLHVLCLLSGEMDQAVGGSSRRLSQGGVRVSPGHSSHSIDFADVGADCLVVHVSDPDLARRYAEPSPESRFLENEELTLLFGKLAGEAATERPLAWLTVREIMAAARMRSSGSDHQPPRWLLDAREEFLAAELGERRPKTSRDRVSSEHLIRSFRRYFGVTPGDVRRIGMLTHAVRLLASHEASLVEASLDSGFAHQSHMTNVMRRTLGVTPGAWRASAMRFTGVNPVQDAPVRDP